MLSKPLNHKNYAPASHRQVCNDDDQITRHLYVNHLQVVNGTRLLAKQVNKCKSGRGSGYESQKLHSCSKISLQSREDKHVWHNVILQRVAHWDWLKRRTYQHPNPSLCCRLCTSCPDRESQQQVDLKLVSSQTVIVVIRRRLFKVLSASARRKCAAPVWKFAAVLLTHALLLCVK